MLEILITVLLTSWVLGMLSSYTLSGAIHLLLLIAAVLVVLRCGRRRGLGIRRLH